MMNGSGLKLRERFGLVGSERSEAERSEAERSRDPTKPAVGRVRVSAPDPEVSSASGRRRFSAAYKARIVRKADACKEPGEVGVLLRREGLYSSHLTKWRREYRQGAEAALADDKRGRKSTKNPLADENDKLRRELERTQKKLAQAELIIDFQKNLCEMLGISPTGISKDGEK
jgi:transposase-like protein